MKKILRILPLVLIAALCLSLICLAAEEPPVKENLWRLNDYMQTFSDEKASELDERIQALVKEKHLDLPICLNNDYGENSLQTFGEWFYEHNGFGYGENKEGLLLVVNTSTKEAKVLSFGPETKQVFTDQICDLFGGVLALALEQDGAEHVIDLFLYCAEHPELLSEDSGSVPTTVPETPAAETPAAETPEEMPSWYPADVASFKDFLNPDAPCVVDDADIFTDEEEKAFTEQLRKLREKHGADFVLFTDVSTHGLRRSVYGADFYIFNGHGVGADQNGMFLFICMEPGNRGWWEAGTGACEKLFTEKCVNYLDDRLEPHMKSGDYAVGVKGFFEDIDQIFESGKVPLTSGEITTAVVVTTIISLIVMLIVRGVMRGKMKVVRIGSEADEYLDRDTFKLRASHNYFLRTVTTRQRIERSSSGGSSHSSGYSSSSGHSFSGGGRSF